MALLIGSRLKSAWNVLQNRTAMRMEKLNDLQNVFVPNSLFALAAQAVMTDDEDLPTALPNATKEDLSNSLFALAAQAVMTDDEGLPTALPNATKEDVGRIREMYPILVTEERF
jgi:hypothetical protein